MADRVIGLDVGTAGVRAVGVVLGTPPRLQLVGQVGLPSGAVLEGEVVDPVAVATALRALWKEVGFKGRSVRVAIASPRVIVRPVDMPKLSESDTRAALSFQLGDYIPMLPSATRFDFQELHTAGEARAKERQVLLAAAPRDAVQPLVDAVKQAGLRVTHIDVASAALARLVAPSAQVTSPPSAGIEGIVSIGGGTIVVVVAREGEPVFARTVSNTSGSAITDRIASDLSIQPAEAELLKRYIPDETPPDVAARVLVITDPFVTEITEEIGDSLDYFASQSGGQMVGAVTITGGGALVGGLQERLERRLGVPVRIADPFQGFTVGPDIGPEALRLLAPFMGVAIGTALGAERSRMKQINLMPESVRGEFWTRRPLVIGGLAAVGLVGGTYLYLGQGRALSDAKAERITVEQDLAVARELAISQAQTGDQAAGANMSAESIYQLARASDVDWATVATQLDALSDPLGISITSVVGTARDASTVVVTPTASTTPAPAATGEPAASTTTVATTAPPVASPEMASLGTLAVSGVAPDLFAIAAWIDAVTADGRFDAAWVDTSNTEVAADGPRVLFTATITLSELDLVARDTLTAVQP